MIMPDEIKPTYSPQPTADHVKTPEQIALEKRRAEHADALAKSRALAEKTAAENAELAKDVGRTFTDGFVKATVLAFDHAKMIGPNLVRAYLVNFGNPHVSRFIDCDDFKTQYPQETQG